MDFPGVDLNSEIDAKEAAKITLVAAVGINNQCEIAVNGYNNRTGDAQSFVLALKNASTCN
jgi:hypothetical protein